MEFYALTRVEYDALTLEELWAMNDYRAAVLDGSADAEGSDDAE